MTEKEKAIKIYNTYWEKIPFASDERGAALCKKCSIIAIDEMIEAASDVVAVYEGHGYVNSDISGQHLEYLKGVKQEIEKL